MTITDPKGKTSAPIPKTVQGTFLFNDANAHRRSITRSGPPTASSRSPSTSSTSGRATSPPEGSSPKGPARPGRRLQDQDRLQPGRRHPPDDRGASRVVEGPGGASPSASSAWSGTSTTGGSTFEPARAFATGFMQDRRDSRPALGNICPDLEKTRFEPQESEWRSSERGRRVRTVIALIESISPGSSPADIPPRSHRPADPWSIELAASQTSPRTDQGDDRRPKSFPNQCFSRTSLRLESTIDWA